MKITQDWKIEDYPFYYEYCEENPDDCVPLEKLASYIGKDLFFEYHCLESEQSQDAELWHRTHRKVKILEMLTPSEADLPMFRIRFEDGLEADAFWYEVLESENDFQPLDKCGRIIVE
jgi:hypothetical protein